MLSDNAINLSKILDSGNRREFDSGAVRDIQEGKGRCDLLPVYSVALLLDHDNFLLSVGDFIRLQDPSFLLNAACALIRDRQADMYGSILDLSKHFEEGAKKYGEHNWEKGIPIHCYVDSAIRHYLKMRRGDTDEPHFRACLWNVLCAHWTILNIKEFAW